MTAKELIDHLKKIVDTHGDLPVESIGPFGLASSVDDAGVYGGRCLLIRGTEGYQSGN